MGIGTPNPDVVAPWLRKSYAGLFVVYALAILGLARRYLRSGFAVMATALCLCQVMTVFLSDLLFAELPFALVSVIFAPVARNGNSARRPWLREMGSFTIASAGFLLRTAGLALLGAWVLEAFVRRRWGLGIARGALALVPVVAWQANVARVRASHEYAHPAYEYQRAPYQYYNVSYAENVLLTDPFRPELGAMDTRYSCRASDSELTEPAGCCRGECKHEEGLLATTAQSYTDATVGPDCHFQRRRVRSYFDLCDCCYHRPRCPDPARRLVDGVRRARVARAHLYDALARSVLSLPSGSGSFFNHMRALGFLPHSYGSA